MEIRIFFGKIYKTFYPQRINQTNDNIFTFMYKQQNIHDMLDLRDIRTRAHDATLFVTNRPQCEKYKSNVFYYGARLWNQLPVYEREIYIFVYFKTVQKRKAFL